MNEFENILTPKGVEEQFAHTRKLYGTPVQTEHVWYVAFLIVGEIGRRAQRIAEMEQRLDETFGEYGQRKMWEHTSLGLDAADAVKRFVELLNENTPVTDGALFANPHNESQFRRYVKDIEREVRLQADRLRREGLQRRREGK